MPTFDICLSEEALQRLASNELTPAELSGLEQHLEDCPRCLALLKQESDAGWIDDSTIGLLKASANKNLPHAIADEDLSNQTGERFLSLLGPTDDPHRLGRIDSYEVVGIIGRGGTGVVFKAYDPALQRFVAIKMLLPHLAESAAARKRFAREAKSAAAVVDDYVLPIYCVAQWRESPYLVSRYCRGETLQKRIETNGALELKEVLRISLQIARGLAAAHAQGIIHRDVKPANILLEQGVERAQLTDFGLARAIDDASMTRTGVLAGTPQFMSPEQSRGEPLDGRSDLFSLGSVIYTMCTGRPPFRASQPLAVLQKITQEKHRPVQSINADIPAVFSQLIDRLLEKDASARFPTAAALADWLESYLAHLQQPLSQAKPKLPRSRRQWQTYRQWSVAFASVALVVASFVYGWIQWRTPAPDSELNSRFAALAAAPKRDELEPAEREPTEREPTLSNRTLALARLLETQGTLNQLEADWWAQQTEIKHLADQVETFSWPVEFDQVHVLDFDTLNHEIQQLNQTIEHYHRKHTVSR